MAALRSVRKRGDNTTRIRMLMSSYNMMHDYPLYYFFMARREINARIFTSVRSSQVPYCSTSFVWCSQTQWCHNNCNWSNYLVWDCHGQIKLFLQNIADYALLWVDMSYIYYLCSVTWMTWMTSKVAISKMDRATPNGQNPNSQTKTEMHIS